MTLTVADLMSDKEKVRHNHKTSLKPHIAVAISGSIYNEAVIKEAFHIAQKEHAKFTAIYIDVFERTGNIKIVKSKCINISCLQNL